MAVRVASESEGRTPERLTVGVAARLSQYLRVLTQARKMGEERFEYFVDEAALRALLGKVARR